MLVEAGRVVARGHSIPIPESIQRVDLRGKWLLPGFIDAHCHVLPSGLDLLNINLSGTTSHQDVLDLLLDQVRANSTDWIKAVQYDQNRYGGIHLSRNDLDSVSQTQPIVLRHSNGHASVVNSAALVAAGIEESVIDPPDGSYGRDDSGRLNGLLLESPHERMAASAPRPTKDEMVQAILRSSQLMASQGITCASDMMTGFYGLSDEIEAYLVAAQAGNPVRTRLYLQWNEVFGSRAKPNAIELARGLAHSDAVRVAGIKIFADGAISSGTAAIYGRFLGERKPGRVKSRRPVDLASQTDLEVDGQLMYSADRLNMMVETAHEAGFSVSVHSIGDYSTDLVMDALERTGEPSRHRIEHTMILSDSQIARLAALKIHCALQPEFLMWLGASYHMQLGPERASMLIRRRSMMDAGVPVSFNSDRPIVPGDPWDGILTAEKAPKMFAPEENCTRLEALLAYTVGGANANREPDLMGTLNPGSLADFQVYSGDPLTLADGRHALEQM